MDEEMKQDNLVDVESAEKNIDTTIKETQEIKLIISTSRSGENVDNFQDFSQKSYSLSESEDELFDIIQKVENIVKELPISSTEQKLVEHVKEDVYERCSLNEPGTYSKKLIEDIPEGAEVPLHSSEKSSSMEDIEFDNEELFAKEKIVQMLETTKTSTKCNKAHLTLKQLKIRCRETIDKLEKQCTELRKEFEKNEETSVKEKLKLCRLQNFAKVVDEMATKKENEFQESLDKLCDQINLIEMETQRTLEFSCWLEQENQLLIWFLGVLNRINFKWAWSRMCCSSTVRI